MYMGPTLTLGLIAQMFGYMTPRVIRVAAMYHFDGLTQPQIAEAEKVTERTVRNDLAQFAEALARSNVAMPPRPRATTRHVGNISPALMRSL